jgi:iron complex outermembrane receptor protein
VGKTENKNLNPVFTYQGRPNSYRDLVAESRIYHTVSVSYKQADWEVLAGVANVFNATPPQVSTGATTSRYGNVAPFATQYDYFGRTPFVRLKYKF